MIYKMIDYFVKNKKKNFSGSEVAMILIEFAKGR